MRKKNKKPPQNVSAAVNLTILGKPLRLDMTVPVGYTKPVKMLPVFRSITQSFVNLAVENAREIGREVSCTKGCAACCRQLIPVSQIEAYRLRDVVNAMQEPQKSRVLKRFEEAKQKMLEVGLLEKLKNPTQIADDDYRVFGLDYFAQYVDCPFLEEETCTIHNERPIVCREYLAVSPAENCMRLTNDSVEILNIPGEMLRALGYFNTSQNINWIPLILALDWSGANPDETAAIPGTEILRELFKRLTGQDVPETS